MYLEVSLQLQLYDRFKQQFKVKKIIMDVNNQKKKNLSERKKLQMHLTTNIMLRSAYNKNAWKTVSKSAMHWMAGIFVIIGFINNDK